MEADFRLRFVKQCTSRRTNSNIDGKSGGCSTFKMTDEEIRRLIEVPKGIPDPPSKSWRADESHRRKDFRMVSKDGELQFRAFARQSIKFQENFSIGLEYEPEDGSEGIILLRCNGPHGLYNRSTGTAPPHFHPHIHIATAAALEAGEKAESRAQLTTEYAVLKDAMRYFLGRVSLDVNDQARWFGDELRTTQYDLELGL